MSTDDGRAGGRTPAAPALVEDVHVLGALSAAAVLLAAWTFPWWGGVLPGLCPLREVTGIPCPTCFGTRAVTALMAGDWRTSLRLNPMVGAAAIGLIAYLPFSIATIVGAWPRPRLATLDTAGAARSGVALVLANWIYLLIAHG